jgi:hypothetical protein
MTTPLPVEPPPPPAPPAQPTGGTRGVGALIVAIVALVLALIPFASYVAGFVAIVAVILGVLAVRRAARKGLSITAIVLGAIALVLAIVMSIVYTVVFFLIPVAVKSFPSELQSAFPTGLPSDFPTDFPTDLPSDFPTDLPSVQDLSNAPETGAGGSVVFKVTGDGTAQTINYTVASPDVAGNSTVSSTGLPWTKSVGIGTDTTYSAYAVIAQSASGGKIACSITVNGKVVAKNSATGQFSVATCTASSAG